MKVIVLVPEKALVEGNGRQLMTTCQNYVKAVLASEYPGEPVDFIDSYTPDFSVTNGNVHSSRLASLAGKVAQAKFAYFHSGWENDRSLKLLKALCEDDCDGISHAIVAMFRK